MSQRPYLLSFIVPFYNNADFVVESLRSLFSQMTDDIEAVIIDDGSTDDSARLVKQLLDEYQPAGVTLISQPNGGIAHARNVGLANAHGRYVTFLDGDDALSRHYLRLLRPILLGDEYDLIDFNYQKFSTTVPDHPIDDAVGLNPYPIENNQLACLAPLFSRSMWHLWNRVYKRSLLAGESFATGRRYEDVIFTPFLYFKTQKIARLNQVLYFYRDNCQGITRNNTAKDIEDLRFAMNKMVCFALQHENKAQIRPLAALMIANCFSEIKNMSKSVHGYYYYTPALLDDFRRAADVCRGTAVPRKKICQMRYPQIDTLLSKLRRQQK
jgi:glycosyltransferase involved in cell wall biosynthesis